MIVTTLSSSPTSLQFTWLRQPFFVLFIGVSIITLFTPKSLITDANEIKSTNSLHGGHVQKKSKENGIFVQIPYSNPPTVRPPPYTISDTKCPGTVI